MALLLVRCRRERDRSLSHRRLRERDAADGERRMPCGKDGCNGARRNASYFSELIEMFTHLSPLSCAIGLSAFGFEPFETSPTSAVGPPNHARIENRSKAVNACTDGSTS